MTKKLPKVFYHNCSLLVQDICLIIIQASSTVHILWHCSVFFTGNFFAARGSIQLLNQVEWDNGFILCYTLLCHKWGIRITYLLF